MYSIVTKNRINQPDLWFLISQHTEVLCKIYNKKKRQLDSYELHCPLYSSLAWMRDYNVFCPCSREVHGISFNTFT